MQYQRLKRKCSRKNFTMRKIHWCAI